jgi:hypothetical protein
MDDYPFSLPKKVLQNLLGIVSNFKVLFYFWQIFIVIEQNFEKYFDLQD